MGVDRIERAEVIVCSPGRNFVTLEITTSDGIVGWGDATLNGRELAVAAYLIEHVVPAIIGRSVRPPRVRQAGPAHAGGGAGEGLIAPSR